MSAQQMSADDREELARFRAREPLLQDFLGLQLLKAVEDEDHDKALDEVRELLMVGANPNYENLSQFTVLHNACSEGNTLCVAELLKAGADPNAKDSVLNTALHFAAQRLSESSVAVLVSYDNIKDVCARNADQQTAYDMAIAGIKSTPGWLGASARGDLAEQTALVDDNAVIKLLRSAMAREAANDVLHSLSTGVRTSSVRP